MAMMVDSLFLDTNIILRAFNKADAQYEKASIALREWIEEGIALWISRQVIREYLFVITRPQVFLTQPKTSLEARGDILQMQRLFYVADETALVTTRLLDLISKKPTGGRQIFDANIVATMLVYNISTVVTLNVTDFVRFQDIIKIETLG